MATWLPRRALTKRSAPPIKELSAAVGHVIATGSPITVTVSNAQATGIVVADSVELEPTVPKPVDEVKVKAGR
ncbi:MAG: hypothetical protein U0992_06260 [Planctomycetaceae bacterium]